MKYMNVVLCCLLAGALYGESSKMTKVDLDVKTTSLIKADLGRDDLYYYMDATACICWVSQTMGSNFGISTFDCKKLAAHPKFEKYVEACPVPKVKDNPFSELPPPVTLHENSDKDKDKDKVKDESKISDDNKSKDENPDKDKSVSKSKKKNNKKKKAPSEEPLF